MTKNGHGSHTETGSLSERHTFPAPAIVWRLDLFGADIHTLFPTTYQARVRSTNCVDFARPIIPDAGEIPAKTEKYGACAQAARAAPL
jgi:hypothetical protein